jgi:hypothetical protein
MVWRLGLGLRKKRWRKGVLIMEVADPRTRPEEFVAQSCGKSEFEHDLKLCQVSTSCCSSFSDPSPSQIDLVLLAHLDCAITPKYSL